MIHGSRRPGRWVPCPDSLEDRRLLSHTFLGPGPLFAPPPAGVDGFGPFDHGPVVRDYISGGGRDRAPGGFPSEPFGLADRPFLGRPPLTLVVVRPVLVLAFQKGLGAASALGEQPESIA